MSLPSPVPQQKVLVVDDEDAVRRVIERSLARAGFSVLAVASASEAMALFRAEGAEVCLIVADVRMPYVTGPEMISELAREAELPPVLYVSGFADESDLDVVRAQGAHLLTKPFVPDALVAKVREILGE